MSGERVQELCPPSVIEQWLKQHTGLPAANRQTLTTTVRSLLLGTDKDPPTGIGISGAPGSGKSTLARALTYCLNLSGVPACLLSLDDYYFGQPDRVKLAAQIHPLLRHRGVPGTHDLGRLLADYDRLRTGKLEGLRLPVFDKSIDDRLPESKWRTPEAAPRIIVVEGWCIGAMPQEVTEMANPVNHLERSQDPDQIWRHHVQHQLQIMYSAFKERLGEVWYIRVPNWECVIQWRWQQEQELASGRLKSRDEVEFFLASFERIFRHMQASYPRWADGVISADKKHDFRIESNHGPVKRDLK
jgi:D-glycerate 3-kinase